MWREETSHGALPDLQTERLFARRQQGHIHYRGGPLAENKEGERFATWVGAPDEPGLWSC